MRNVVQGILGVGFVPLQARGRGKLCRLKSDERRRRGGSWLCWRVNAGPSFFLCSLEKLGSGVHFRPVSWKLIVSTRWHLSAERSFGKKKSETTKHPNNPHRPATGSARRLLALCGSDVRNSPPSMVASSLTRAALRAPLLSRQARLFTSSTRTLLPASFAGPPPSYFQKPRLPANTVVRFVPQQTAWIVERMGRFNRILEPGLAVMIPFLDRIAYVKSLKEAAIEIPSQSAITADNVTLELDGVLYTRVFDAYKAR